MVENLPVNAGDSGSIPDFQEDPLEKEMASYFSILAWRVRWTEEPDGLQSIELQKNWTLLSDSTTATAILE